MKYQRIMQLIFLGLLMFSEAAPRLLGQTSDGSMTKDERNYLLSLLQASESSFVSSIDGLTQAQWTFKPSPDSWSIEECAEHLILAEDLIFSESQKVLTTAPAPRLANASSDGDRQIVEQMEDRSKKAKAPKVLQPTDKFPTPENAAKEFESRRNKTIAYVETTQDRLRVHVGDGPSGSPADVYQFLLEMAAHTVRHTAQIREVKSASGYPSPERAAVSRKASAAADRSGELLTNFVVDLVDCRRECHEKQLLPDVFCGPHALAFANLRQTHVLTVVPELKFSRTTETKLRTAGSDEEKL